MSESTTDNIVTLAMIQQDIQYLRTDIGKMDKRLCGKMSDHEDRIRSLEKSSWRGDIFVTGWATLTGIVATILGNR